MINPTKKNLSRLRPHTANMDSFNGFIDSKNAKIVQESYSAKYLGINLQTNLFWDSHVNDLKMKIAPAIGIIYEIKTKLDINSKFMIYRSLIESRLNYLAIVYALNIRTTPH